MSEELQQALFRRIAHWINEAAELRVQRDELLAALKQAEHVIWYENSTEYPELLAKLQVIIAKAETQS